MCKSKDWDVSNVTFIRGDESIKASIRNGEWDATSVVSPLNNGFDGFPDKSGKRDEMPTVRIEDVRGDIDFPVKFVHASGLISVCSDRKELSAAIDRDLKLFVAPVIVTVVVGMLIFALVGFLG